ncbi:MAG: NAD(P)/FAD-dependent oxidoreductase [Deltaproteobacteria bacterium]|nr:NAD(P)/FAD-dependent oxidoreductase [Deltaproteobacteria bacterium]
MTENHWENTISEQKDRPAPTIVIIGGGPAGLMAAGQAATMGARVLVLEKMDRPALKLGITGKGRCNITNIAEVREFINHFGKSGLFLRQAFSRFFNTDLMDFLENIGLKLVAERGGRVFPASGKALDVVGFLLKWAKNSGVQIRTASPVDGLLIKDGVVKGVVCKGENIYCHAVILSSGGASYAATGSTGDGYRLAETAGHRVIPIRPALVPLETAGNQAGRMADLNLRNINVKMLVDGKKRREAFGELVFADFGVTGPVILTLSGETVDLLQLGKKIELSIDLKPALDERKLDARLLRDLEARGKEPVNSILRGLIPREMVPVCLDSISLPSDRRGNSLSAEERKRLRYWLKDFRLEVTGHRPFAEAIITAGGVDTREVDPRTMESRKVKGLYFAGEVLDLQADTGGYNLQAAFSTGWLAGRSAAQQPAIEK